MPHAQADRARRLAAQMEMKLVDLAALLVDRAYEAEFGVRPTSILKRGDELLIPLGDDLVPIPASLAGSVADDIRRGVSDIHLGTIIDLDTPAMLTIERARKGIFISTLDGTGIRHKLPTNEALRLADDLAQHAAA